MDVREAVAKAREYVSDVYAGEEIKCIGLEEIRFDDAENFWKVTIGFYRPWDRDTSSLTTRLRELHGADPVDRRRRAFKVIQIDDESGRIVAMTHRILK